MQQPRQSQKPLDWDELPDIPAYPQDEAHPERQTLRWVWPVLLAALVFYLNFKFSSRLPWLCWAWFGFCLLWFILSLRDRLTPRDSTFMLICILLFLIDFVGELTKKWENLSLPFIWPLTWPLILAGFTILLSLKADPPWWWSWIWPILLVLSMLVLAFLIGKLLR